MNFKTQNLFWLQKLSDKQINLKPMLFAFKWKLKKNSYISRNLFKKGMFLFLRRWTQLKKVILTIFWISQNRLQRKKKWNGNSGCETKVSMKYPKLKINHETCCQENNLNIVLAEKEKFCFYLQLKDVLEYCF